MSNPTGSDSRTVHPVASRYPGPLRFYAATLIFPSFITWWSVKLLTYGYKLVNLIIHKALVAPPSGSTIQLILKIQLNINIWDCQLTHFILCIIKQLFWGSETYNDLELWNFGIVVSYPARGMNVYSHFCTVFSIVNQDVSVARFLAHWSLPNFWFRN